MTFAEFVVMRSQFFFFFCHFYWRNGFPLSLLSFCYSEFYRREEACAQGLNQHLSGSSTVSTSDFLTGWQLGRWPRTRGDRIYRSTEIPLLLVFLILQFSIILCHLSYPGGKFSIWSLDRWFKKAPGAQMLCIPIKYTTLKRRQNEKNRLLKS